MATNIAPPSADDDPSRSAIGRLTNQLSRLGASGSIKATGRFLYRQLWVWPIIAALLVGGVGWFVNSAVEEAMRQNRIHSLNAILEAEVAALKVWMDDQRALTTSISLDEQLRLATMELLNVANNAGANAERELVLSKAQEALRSRLSAKLQPTTYVGFFVVAPSGLVVAADQDAPVGKLVDGYRRQFFDSVLAGHSAVSQPYRSPLMLTDEKDELRTGVPTMFAGAPILSSNGRRIAALGLRIQPQDQFTRILSVARFGETGETYAFDRNGLLLSQSRFDDQLKQAGLLADQADSRSLLTVELRDPQVDMTTGARPRLRRAEQPLTRMAADAIQGRDGVDASGYRDYRGVPVIGAWRWLDEYDFGVATEVDVAESFRPAYILRRVLRLLLGLLVVSSIGIFVAMVFMQRQQKRLQQAVLQAKRLGQYTLEDKLGAGGMGTVYKARHAMLRRPTAIKLLNLESMSDSAVARFEREVQLTSGLTHPNTVAIFDYGRTTEGIFYYAMEYLDGTNLEELVKRFGALQEARVVYVLRQVCESLAEAHALGMIHRDIKPANIFLTCRGGRYDFVKVLDFGLAKSLGAQDANVTAPHAMAGTPLYMSPEAINHPDDVDARSDVYGIGAVGYFLLTGTPVFNGASVMEICMKHSQAAPDLPSHRVGRPISSSLEKLILGCLAKSQDDRPRNAADLLLALENCHLEGTWKAADAASWWSTHQASLCAQGPETQSSVSQQSAASTEKNHDATMLYQDTNSLGVTIANDTKRS